MSFMANETYYTNGFPLESIALIVLFKMKLKNEVLNS